MDESGWLTVDEGKEWETEEIGGRIRMRKEDKEGKRKTEGRNNEINR